MATDESSTDPDSSQSAGRAPLSAAKRKRLQQLFAHGSKQMAQENYDYATELFAECVKGDPSNLIYVQNYIGNLQRKHRHNKTGSKLAQFKERGARSGVKKALSRREWGEVILHGLKVLTVNPWDVPVLVSMATASDESGHDEVELFYLKCALEANPKDPEVNRHCAMALAARQEFDQAMACWHRVLQARPDDDEAKRAMYSLAVEKTIKHGRYESDEEERKLAGDRRSRPQTAQPELSKEEVLRGKINRHPEELDNYYELAQWYINHERYRDAEEVYAQGFEASGGDPDVREKWEDAQLRHLRQQIKRCEDDELRQKLRREMILKELEFCKNRCQRYPNNLSFKYDLGYRYQLTGDYNEAIKQLQVARNDPRKKGMCLYRLGQCFQKIKQQRLALSHYESAIEEIPARETEARKDVLYWAGKIALSLSDLERAEGHLTRLAGLDFTYRDVSGLLDQLAKLRENNQQKPSA